MSYTETKLCRAFSGDASIASSTAISNRNIIKHVMKVDISINLCHFVPHYPLSRLFEIFNQFLKLRIPKM